MEVTAWQNILYMKLFCVQLLMVVMMILFRYRRVKDVITVCWNH